MAFPTRASYTKSRTQASGLSALRSTAPGSPLVPFADTSRQRTVSGATLQREALQANNPPSRPNEESNVPSRMIQKVFTEYALAKGISCYIDFTEEDTPPAQFDIVFDQSQIKPWGQFSLKAAAYARHFHAQYGTLEVSMASSSLPYLLNDAAQISRLPETRKEAVIRAVCEMVDAINIAVGKENIKHGVPDKGLRFVDGEYLSDNATQGLDLSECVSIVSMTPGGRYRTTKDGKAGLMFSDAPVAGLILVVKEFAVAPVAEGKLGWVEAAAKNIAEVVHKAEVLELPFFTVTDYYKTYFIARMVSSTTGPFFVAGPYVYNDGMVTLRERYLFFVRLIEKELERCLDGDAQKEKE